MSEAAPAAPPAERIEPPRGFAAPDLAEIWRHRGLLYFFTWRDVKVRYKQTVLGAAWAILQPFLAMVVFTLFFGKMAGVASDGVPYPIFSYAALLPWTFLQQGVTQASGSLVQSANLLRKVAFPRLIVPVATVVAGLVDLALAGLVLGGMMVFFGFAPAPAALLLPLLVLLAFATAVGIGTWLAALNVQFRDVKYVVPFLLQLWLFASPVIYPTGTVVRFLEARGIPGWVYGLNPVTGIVEGFRQWLLGTGASSGVALGPILLAGTVSALVLLLGGLLWFRRVERTLADVV